MPTLQFSEGPKPWINLTCRKQLLNHVVDGKAHVRPESVWAKVPRDASSYGAGYRKITYKLFANAINGIASWILRELGRSTTFETLAYFGDWDPRYIIMILGAVKAGYKLVTPSPAYPARGLVALLDSLDCKTILTASKKFPVVAQLEGLHSRRVYEVPSLNELLETIYEHVPFDKTFEEAESEPLVVIHTSGTTGIPKPLILTHGWAACWIEHNQLSPPPSDMSVEQLLHGVELCSVTPPFHSSGFFPNFWGAIPNDIVCIYPLPQATFSFETAVAMIRNNDPSALIAPPYILVELANNAEIIQEFSSKISLIGYGGGPLPELAGSTLAEHFQVVSIYGTSEMGLVSKITSSGPWERDSWRGFKPHPKDNMQFQPLQGDLYEAVIVRNNATEEMQAVFKLYPELKEWRTKDIFSPDPGREGHWIYQSRIDDVIILSDGGTLNPLGFEQQLMKVPFVTQALLGGSGKRRTALLVELHDPPDGVMDLLWEKVEECNAKFPPQVTVSRSHIIVADSDRPLPRAAKGNVQRVPAFRLYEKDIDALY